MPRFMFSPGSLAAENIVFTYSGVACCMVSWRYVCRGRKDHSPTFCVVVPIAAGGHLQSSLWCPETLDFHFVWQARALTDICLLCAIWQRPEDSPYLSSIWTLHTSRWTTTSCPPALWTAQQWALGALPRWSLMALALRMLFMMTG